MVESVEATAKNVGRSARGRQRVALRSRLLIGLGPCWSHPRFRGPFSPDAVTGEVTPTRRLLGYLRPFTGLLGVGLVVTMAASILDGVTVVLLSPLLETLFGTTGSLGDTPTQLTVVLTTVLSPVLSGATPGGVAARIVGLLLLGLVLKNACIVAADQLSTAVEEGLVRDLRGDLFRHLLRVDLGFLERTQAGDLISATMVDIDQAKRVVAAGLTSFMRSGIAILVTLIILANLSWRLTLLTLATAPLLIGTIQLLLGRLRRHARDWATLRAELTTTVTERLAAIKLIRVTGNEEAEAKRFAAQADAVRTRVIRTQRFAAMTSPFAEVFGGAVIVLVIWAARRPALAGLTLGPAETIIFLVAALKMMSPLKSITQFPAQMTTALAGAERVFALLDQPLAEPLEEEGREAEFHKRIEFDQVSFRYGPEEPWVLQDISFSVPRGAVVAIVGASGAGKTTLIELLLRFHDPTQGRIALDGVPLTACRRATIRHLLGVVSQDTVILNDTVSANIGYGSPASSHDQIVAVARAAHAHDFIQTLPAGYATHLGERGTRLSGGQRQRIAIARALLRDAPIFILDEATSALDSESELVVHQAIDHLMADRTVLVIAHRLATIRHADEVVVLHGGRVVDRGHHRDLIARDGMYRRLYGRQDLPPVESAL